MIVAAGQTIGIFFVGGATELSSMLAIAVAVSQSVVAISTYVVGNATLTAFAKVNLEHVDRFIQKKIESFFYKSLLYLIISIFTSIIAVRVGAIPDGILFESASNDFYFLMLIVTSSFLPVHLNSLMFARFRAHERLEKYELTNIFASVISVAGVLWFLNKGNLMLCGASILLRSALPVITMLPGVLLIKKNTNILSEFDPAIEYGYDSEAKKLLLGSLLFKLMTPFDRVVISAISPTSAIVFAIAQQLLSVFDAYIIKAKLTPLLHRKSLELAMEPGSNKNYVPHLRPAMIFFILGVVYYCTLNIVIFLVPNSLSAGHLSGNLSSYSVLQMYVLLMFGQPFFSSSASYLNGLFYCTGRSEVAVIVGTTATVLGCFCKVAAVVLGYDGGVALSTSLQYGLALLTLILILVKMSRSNI
jgi:hypothetical protein